ncbi:MAG: tetratricopeptide repeat protein [Nitrospiraceae bacterium]
MRPSSPTLPVVVIGSKVMRCLLARGRPVLALARRRLLILLFGLLLVSPTVTARSEPSPLVAEFQEFSTRFHEDPARLDQILERLDQALETNSNNSNTSTNSTRSYMEQLLAMAQVCFIWGDIRATTDNQKLEAYERGQEVARRSLELEPNNPAAHFWFAVNTGRWGQTNGVLSSLFLATTVKREIEIILNLDPHFTLAYSLAGNFYYEVPSFLGGDVHKAEAMFRKGLEQDPTFTELRVGLAKTLISQRRIDEARQELQAVLDEKEPRNLAYWTLKDSKEALELLHSVDMEEPEARLDAITVATTFNSPNRASGT